MNSVEDLLRRDRAIPLPEPPDVRFTASAVRRRMGGVPLKGARKRRARGSVDWLIFLGALGTVAGAALTAVTLGLNPWWLLAFPVSALPFSPILLRKGA